MDFFQDIEKRFGSFDLDPCSDHDNAKADVYYTKAEDGLSKVILMSPIFRVNGTSGSMSISGSRLIMMPTV